MLFQCVVVVCAHSVHLSVSFSIPSRYDSVALQSSPGVLEVVFLFPFSITWLGAALSFLSRVHFPPKTSTRCKFPVPFSVFPSRPFVFRLYIIFSCESGHLSRVIPILFPCPVNYLSRSEWPAFSACFWNLARFSRAIFVFFFFARHFFY